MFNKKFFAEMMDDHQIYHSNFQIDHFITEKNGITDYGMYKQSLRELHTRFHELKKAILEFEICKHEMNEMERKITGSANDKRLAELKYLQKKLEVESVGDGIEHRIREFVRFYWQAKHLKEKVGELTSRNRDILEYDFWIAKIERQAAYEILAHKSVSVNTIENIMGLPEATRERLLDIVIHKPVELIDSLKETFNDYELGEYEVKEVDMQDVRSLLYAANGLRDAIVTRIKESSLRELLEDNAPGRRGVSVY